MWSNFGVNVTFNGRDLTAHYAHLRDRGDFDVARAGWIGDYSDPQNFLFLIESDNPGFNYAQLQQPRVRRADGRGRRRDRSGGARQAPAEAEAMFMRDLPFIPLLYYSSHSLVSPQLSGWEDNIQNVHPTRLMSLSDGS